MSLAYEFYKCIEWIFYVALVAETPTLRSCIRMGMEALPGNAPSQSLAHTAAGKCATLPSGHSTAESGNPWLLSSFSSCSGQQHQRSSNADRLTGVSIPRGCAQSLCAAAFTTSVRLPCVPLIGMRDCPLSAFCALWTQVAVGSIAPRSPRHLLVQGR